jgi:tRNA A-37 threonylcarbamoyl transferase component Bud32
MQIEAGGDKLARGISLARAVRESGRSLIVYDDSRVSQITPQFFEAAHWPSAAQSAPELGGRAPVLFVEHADQSWVIRHYYRGGMVGRFLVDRFPWSSVERTRAVREWDLLTEMRSLQLPVPAPVAAHVLRSGVWYRADLITECLPAVESLAQRFIASSLTMADWAAVGICIARFHELGFFHADLNAFNIQLDAAGAVYVLDWDRGARRAAGGWAQDNVARLERSLHKITTGGDQLLAPADWQVLVSAYRDAPT